MNCSRLAAAGIAATVLGLAVPSLASAADYCVAPNYDCGPNNFQKLQDALDQAATTPDPDRVLLGEATYVAPNNQFAFFYNTPSSPVEIVGAGRGHTVLTASQYALDRVLLLGGGPDSSVRDLTIKIPPKVSGGFRGLLAMGTARRIEIVADGSQTEPFVGAELWDNGALEDSTVTLSTEQETTGVLAKAPPERGAAVRGTAITAKTGMASLASAAIERSRITGGEIGLEAIGGDMTVRNSLIRQTWTYGTALKAETRNGVDTKVTADGLTVIGGNTIDAVGIFATTSPMTDRNVDVSLANSVIRGAFASLGAAANGNGTARIATSYSDYNPSEDAAFGGAHIDESHATNVGDAGFVDSANGDYRLNSGSRLVDKGDPDVAPGVDIDGNPLIADGNGDGFARRDLGAFELQPPAPQPEPEPQGDTQAPVISGFRASRASVSYRLSESARVIVKVQRRLAGKRARYRTVGAVAKGGAQGANRLGLTRRIRARAAHPGRYRAVIVAVDTAGNRSAAKAATFRVKR